MNIYFTDNIHIFFLQLHMESGIDNRSFLNYIFWDEIIYKENRRENNYSNARQRGSGQLRNFGESFYRHQRLSLEKKEISLAERDLDAR